MSLTGLAFFGVFFAGIAMALVRHPIYGLYTYVAVFYLHPPSRWWGETLPDLRWSLFVAAVTLLASLRLPADKRRPPWYSHTPAKILIAFTVWVWIQNAWAISAEDHRELSILYTKYIVLFYLVYRLIDTPQRLRAFLLMHIAGCAYLGWLGYITPVSGRLEGVGGPGIDEANALAMQLGTAVMIGAMVILVERKWRLWFALAAMPFLINTIVLAGSRGAFLAVLTGGVALWWMKPASHRKLFYGLGVLAVLLMGILAHEAFWERMGTLKATVDETQEMDTSAESRLVLIEAQWQMAKRYPLGAGHRGTEVLSPDYIDEKYMSRMPGETTPGRRSSHNTFMSALVEQGAPGAVLFAMLWLWCARTALRWKRDHASAPPELAAAVAGIAGALVVLLVAGMFVDYLKAEVQVWLFALLASASCLIARTESVERALRPQRSPAVAAAPAAPLRRQRLSPGRGGHGNRRTQLPP